MGKNTKRKEIKRGQEKEEIEKILAKCITRYEETLKKLSKN